MIAVLCADAPKESFAVTEKLYCVDADNPVTLYVVFVTVAMGVALPFS